MTRNAATPARTSRMKMPAPVALPANTRSPGRRLARGGLGGALVVVTDRSVGGRAAGAGVVLGGSRATAARGVLEDLPGRRSPLGVLGQPATVMASMTVCAAARASSVIGELPALSAAACWPSLLTT